MSKPRARMSEDGNYLEWSALDMGAAIPTEAFPIILAALLENAGAVEIQVCGVGEAMAAIIPLRYPLQAPANLSDRCMLLPIQEEGGA